MVTDSLIVINVSNFCVSSSAACILWESYINNYYFSTMHGKGYGLKGIIM